MSEEILDIYNQEGVWQGTAPRSEVHQNGYWHKTAQVWLLNEKDELLLQLRSDDKDCFPGLWDISSAGHIPAGCDITESAVRELEEELGIKADIESLQFLFEHVEPFEDPDLGHIDREIAQVYLLEVSSGIKFQLQEEEVSAVRWIKYQDLLEDYYLNTDNYVYHEAHFIKLVDYLKNLKENSDI